MRIFIAYKYSRVENKEQLKQELLQVAEILESFGNETFILGRDVQNWNNRAHPIHSKYKKMSKEIRASDGLFVYLNSTVFSPGLIFEIHLAKLLGKKIVVAAKNGIKAPYFGFLANEKVISFSDVSELKEKLKLK